VVRVMYLNQGKETIPGHRKWSPVEESAFVRPNLLLGAAEGIVEQKRSRQETTSVYISSY
jgi:hypothetical protein